MLENTSSEKSSLTSGFLFPIFPLNFLFESFFSFGIILPCRINNRPSNSLFYSIVLGELQF